MTMDKACLLLLLSFISSPTVGQSLSDLTQPYRDQYCESLDPFPEESCHEIVDSTIGSVATGILDREALKRNIKAELSNPVFLNAAVSKATAGAIPIGLEFKMLDSQDSESVLGLAYSVDYNLSEIDIEPTVNWFRDLSLDFSGYGTITGNAKENPRNFLDTKFVLAGSYATRIPPQDLTFQTELTNFVLVAESTCTDTPSDTCIDARNAGNALLDSTTEFLRSFQYYKFGIDAGYESDQSFEVTQKKISAFFFGQYESWGNSSFLGALNISPSIRLAVDTIDPDQQTPRALAGDDSRFERFSGELSLWMPIRGVAELPMALTFNYRHYREVGASEMVKAANLESYNLRTFSLTGTNGLFVSYSSGRLPFDQQSDDVLSLGWKSYF